MDCIRCKAEVLSYGMICFGMILWLDFYSAWFLFICFYFIISVFYLVYFDWFASAYFEIVLLYAVMHLQVLMNWSVTYGEVSIILQPITKSHGDPHWKEELPGTKGLYYATETMRTDTRDIELLRMKSVWPYKLLPASQHSDQRHSATKGYLQE